MGHISQLDHPDVRRTIAETLTRIQQRGRVAGTLANNDNVADYTAAGVRFLMATTAPWLNAAATQFISRSQASSRGS